MSARSAWWWFAAALAAAGVATGCEDKVPEPSAEPTRSAAPKHAAPAPTELVKEDLKVGSGPAAAKGDKVKVHYTGRLLETKAQFDSSRGNKPFEFTIGEGSVIKGWDQGLVGMKKGGKRKLTIPAELGYGAKGSPPKIPPNAALVFDIELLEIEGKTATANALASAAASARPTPTPKTSAAAAKPKPVAKPAPTPNSSAASK